MKSVILGCFAATLLAVGAFLVLNPGQIPVSDAYKTGGVRLTSVETGH